MRLADIPLNPSQRMLRQFSAAWIIVFLIWAWFFEFRRGNHTVAAVFVSLAPFGAVGLRWPAVMKWPFLITSFVTFPIGWIISQLVLLVMFYAILTPVGLLLRWRGRDELQVRKDSARTSYWHDRGDPPPPENYLKQF